MPPATRRAQEPRRSARRHYRFVLERTVRWKPVDVLTVVFASALFVVGVLRYGVLDDRSVLLRMAAVALVPVGIAFWRARRPDATGALAVLFDYYLIACDRALFGVDPTVLLEKLATPLLSDVLTIFYALYYFHPIVLGTLVFFDDRARPTRARDFPRYAFVMVFVFYVSYACYFLVPAIGPRYTLAHAGPLPRGAIAQAIDHTLDVLEKNKRDCFPSGHTMVLTAVLLEAYRRSKKTFWAFLPFAAGLFIACLLYTSDADDDLLCVDLGGR